MAKEGPVSSLAGLAESTNEPLRVLAKFAVDIASSYASRPEATPGQIMRLLDDLVKYMVTGEIPPID